VEISPSLLGVDLKVVPWDLLSKHVHRLHIDVLDGTFVKGKSPFNPKNVKALPTAMMRDVHFMTQNPQREFKAYREAGAFVVNFHVEIGRTAWRIQKARDLGLKVGLAISPETSVDVLFPFIKEVDEFLILGVHPGKSGRPFQPGTFEKIEQLREKTHKLIKVDGGVNELNVLALRDAGADIAVMSSGLFKNKTPVQDLRVMMRLINSQIQQ